MDVYVGDKVQIVNGGIDVTNGNRAKSGRYYGEGGPLWATVESITNNWSTGSKWGLPSKVTKIRCSNEGIVVWQVQPEHIASNVIRASKPEIAQTAPKVEEKPVPSISRDSEDKDDSTGKQFSGKNDMYASMKVYAPTMKSEVWDQRGGVTTNTITTNSLPVASVSRTKTITDRAVFTAPVRGTFQKSDGSWRPLNKREKKSIGSNSLKIDPSAINGAKFKTAYQDPSKRRQLLNEDSENILNLEGFPRKLTNASELLSAKYDYQIIPGDSRYSKMITLEDKLKDARAVLGIPVHGNNMIAQAMKYFMYNRFKIPDKNLAHNKSFTHVFFTRPDLNLLTSNRMANEQTLNNTEAAMIWRRHPELFKLLTDAKRCGDSNNFNLLLSNQVTSFEIQDETLTQNRAGKNWNEYEMVYGDSYTGRGAGEFTCNFTETDDYSVIHLLKLWITYIDNVARGAWSPSYNLKNSDQTNIENSHVYRRTLDYAASAYVFKCGPDGEDVLYWSKYYGVFPVNTGASALSWDIGTPVGESPKLSIRFNYSFKRDMSPISLLEFNYNARIESMMDAIAESAYNVNLGHTARPYVGCPFISMKLGNAELHPDDTDHKRNRTEIRLKFKSKTPKSLTDNLLYKNT